MQEKVVVVPHPQAFGPKVAELRDNVFGHAEKRRQKLPGGKCDRGDGEAGERQRRSEVAESNEPPSGISRPAVAGAVRASPVGGPL